jgi:hypothetical protein
MGVLQASMKLQGQHSDTAVDLSGPLQQRCHYLECCYRCTFVPMRFWTRAPNQITNNAYALLF